MIHRLLPVAGYLTGLGLLALAVALALGLGAARAASPDLFISEYVEGSSNSKAVELYNGTGAPVTLDGAYDVQIFANGSATATATVALVGTVADGDAFVLARESADPAVLAAADQTTANFLWNGNDAVALRHAGAIVDVIGQIGTDPGTEWGTGDASTADNTLRRKASVVTGDSDGSDAFDPAVQWVGFPLDTFGGLGAHTVSPGTGSPPDAVADVAFPDEDANPVTVDVLANDSDPDGDPLTVVSATDGAHGVVEVAPGGGAVTYAPEVDWFGADSFAYTISDGQGNEATATVSVTVLPVNDDPDAEDDLAATDEDTPVTVDVLANDDDADGDALTVVEVEQPDHGRASVAVGGTAVVYEPDPDWSGVDALEVTVGDPNGGVESSELVVTVAPVNDPPVALPDVAATRTDESVVIDVLANDSPGPADETGQTLTVVSVGTPANGVAELIASGSDAGRVRYTPAPGYEGPDSFGYSVSDGALTAVGTVSVVVGAAPFRTLCGLAPTIVGTAGADVLTGTPGDDVIKARRGNDTIDGGGGNDVVCAGPGTDSISTGDGEDRIAGGSGPDTISTGDGDDLVRGGFGADVIGAGEGHNRVAAGRGDDQITAGSGNDRIDGGPGTDACDAGGGRNRVTRCE